MSSARLYFRTPNVTHSFAIDLITFHTFPGSAEERSFARVRLIISSVSFYAEIGRVRANLFQISGHEKKPMILPEAVGSAMNLSEKVYVPVKEFPDVST